MRAGLCCVVAAAAVALMAWAPAPAVAARPHVVMIVFDEFPGDALRGPDGRIDAGRFPNFARLAGDATWYPNATTVADWTWRAVPAILDGRWPRKGETSSKRDHRNSIFRLLSRRGYRLHSTEEVTKICHAHGCRRLLGKGFPNLIRKGRFERLRATFRSLHPSRTPSFTFHHSVLPHQPWVYLPSGRRHQAGKGDSDLGLTGPEGYSSPFLTQHSQQRLLLQLGAVDHAIGRLIARLRQTRLYDKTLVVITADHGMAFDHGVKDRREVTESNIDEIAPVPLIVKAPRQHRARVDPAYVRSIDIVPTIARTLRIRIPWHVDGKPASSTAVRSRRSVRMLRRGFTGFIEMKADEFERRRGANIAARASSLGWGSWEPLFRVGPNLELVGRATSELSVGAPGPVTAKIREPGRYRAVDPRSGLVPSSIVGEIENGGRIERNLAVAVNSRIAAVGRTAFVPERFAMMVPEGALHRGRNLIEVFEVKAGPAGPTLVPLGSAP